jgi:glycosyltransferase involved in cell wall biosynthesis
MTVDILLATFNGERFLCELLNSIFEQSYKSWRLVVHDDGSRDETVSILKLYQKKYPRQITIVEDGVETGGPMQNFSHLLNFATAEYVMFCDQDDVWNSRKIEKTLDKMQEIERVHVSKPALVHTDLSVTDENLNTIQSSFMRLQKINPSWASSLAFSSVQNSVTGCTMMLNREAVDVCVPISHKAIMHDWWCLLSVLVNGGIVGYIDEPLIWYRQHESNSVGATGFSIFVFVSRYKKLKSFQAMLGSLGLDISIFTLISRKLLVLSKRLL